MKKRGTLVRWNAERGFGFLRSPDTAADVFVHLRDFRHLAGAPQIGMEVEFEEIHVGGKGPRAMAVRPFSAMATTPMDRQNAARRTTPARPRTTREPAAAPARAGPMLLLVLVWAALIAWGVWAGRLPLLALAAAPILNLLTFYVYWSDKHAAQQGRWRTSESSLHLLGLLGGWPGAWAAQQILRHKSRKLAFRQTYWGTVFLHCAALLGWLFWQY